MRVELCAWKDAINLMKTSPNIKKYGLAEAVKVTEHTATEFLKTYREMFGVQKREVMSKKEINARYHKKKFQERSKEEMYSRKSDNY